MRKYRLKFWTKGEVPKLKEYSLPFRNSSEAYQYIKEQNGIPITVNEVKEPPQYIKRLS